MEQSGQEVGLNKYRRRQYESYWFNYQNGLSQANWKKMIHIDGYKILR